MAGPSKRSRESRPQSGDIVHALCQTGRQFYDRGWVLGASGNFSAIVSRIPLRLAITASGVDKGALTAQQIVEVDSAGATVRGSGRL